MTSTPVICIMHNAHSDSHICGLQRVSTDAH